MTEGRVRFYLDEHVPRAVADGLRRRHIDVMTTHEAAMRGASDEEQLALVATSGRVLVTGDDDFLRLHAAGLHHAGIVYASRPTEIGAVIRFVRLVAEVLTPDDMIGQVEFI